MPTTENHEYNVPEEGAQDWGELLNDNFKALEVDVELRDEGRPQEGDNNYETTEGAKYLDTETGFIYVSDGDDWFLTAAQPRFDEEREVFAIGDAFEIDGDIEVTGTKHFVQAVTTADGPREVVYTASEAPTPRTECSGVAQLTDGRAEVTLPEHFAWVTNDSEPLLVQTTPYAADSGGLAVVERSVSRLVVEDRSGTGEYEFGYTVKGTRIWQEDRTVVRVPDTPGRQQAETDD